MLRFETEVRLTANASPEEILDRLKFLTALPRMYTKPERFKPLRGRIALPNSFLRWPLYQIGRRSVRLLWFDLVAMPGGSILIGKFELPKALRYGVIAWLIPFYVGNGDGLVRDFWYRRGPHVILLDLRNIAICTAMATGFLWTCKWFGRSSEYQLIRVLRVALDSEQGAIVSSKLLSAFGAESKNFVDPDSTQISKTSDF